MKGKELLFGNLEAIKLYSMREILVVLKTYTISYSLFLLVVIILIVFLYFFFKSKKCVELRQCAWEQNKLMLSYRNSHPLLGCKSGFVFKKIRATKRFYSTKTIPNPEFVSGLIDAEGCFYLNVYKAKDYVTGWTLKPSFKLTLHKKDLALLEKILNFFEAGKIYKQRKESFEYRIQNLKDLKIIIAHLDKFPLLSRKKADYELFKQAISLMLVKEHLNLDGLRKIVSIKAAMNRGLLSDDLKLAFPDITYTERPLIRDNLVVSPNWLAGFTTGEGCFFCNLSEGNNKVIIQLVFQITQHARDEQFLRNLIQVLGCGYLKKKTNQEVWDFVVTKFSDINEKIIPFFLNYPIQGEKLNDFQDFCRIADLMKNKAHLTKEGLDKIRLIKSGMNKGRFSIEALSLNNLEKFDDFTVDVPRGGSTEKHTLQSRDAASIFSNQKRNFSFAHFNCSHQRLNVEHPSNIEMYDHSRSINRSKYYENQDNFHLWLVGFTDGDGSFSIIRVAEGKWTLFFKLTQSTYNLRILYFIKKQLGVGSVHIDANCNKGDFRIRDRKNIGSIILPIFDKYPLLTSKYFSYQKFKKAYDILENPNLSTKEKDNLLLKLQSEQMPTDYISPAWKTVNYEVNNTNDAKSVMSKYWLIGFTEAEGSFYLVSKDSIRIVHAFEITQKLDPIVLKSIAYILGISISKKKTHYTVVTTNSRAIFNIIDYYNNTMKGMKTVEFRIWARSYVKHKGNYEKLRKIRDNIRVLRKVRLNKNFVLVDTTQDKNNKD
uniref:LAGLIDADG endonuclease n=1 Tax=Dactylella tenuis TaxID=383872 RepID=A0A4Y5MX08_9PEZI|nr:LAGLIDADG endonuclease [Dactylella tenuis]QCW06801.1 LAGLIDADG endonuclease [Dactylella tenuis]